MFNIDLKEQNMQTRLKNRIMSNNTYPFYIDAEKDFSFRLPNPRGLINHLISAGLSTNINLKVFSDISPFDVSPELWDIMKEPNIIYFIKNTSTTDTNTISSNLNSILYNHYCDELKYHIKSKNIGDEWIVIYTTKIKGLI